MCEKHDHFTDELRNRLGTIGIGLGLVRLLLDAGRAAEARTTLAALQEGFQGGTEESGEASQKQRPAGRSKNGFRFVAPNANAGLGQQAGARRPGADLLRRSKDSRPPTKPVGAAVRTETTMGTRGASWSAQRTLRRSPRPRLDLNWAEGSRTRAPGRTQE